MYLNILYGYKDVFMTKILYRYIKVDYVHNVHNTRTRINKNIVVESV